MAGCPSIGECLQCGLAQYCELGDIDRKKCMRGLAEKIGRERIALLVKDCIEGGRYIQGIEDTWRFITERRNLHVDVYDKDRGHLSKPWAKIVAKSRPIPLICSLQVKDGHIRPSEFGCKIACILSKVDLEKYVQMFNIKLERKLAEIGRTRHELCLTQHCQNFEHAERENLPPRWKYCEKALSYTFESKTLKQELIVAGRADNLFTFDDNHAIGVLDMKRSRHFYYMKHAHERQTLEYALGVAQQLDYEIIYTIVLEGPFEPTPFKYRYPQLHIMKTKVDSPKVKALHEELEESYTDQARLLDDLVYLLSTKVQKSVDKRGCFNLDTGLPCFVKPACDALIRYCEKGKITLRAAIENLNILRKGYILPQL
ncbi:MAG: hypothetical protein QW063_01810 [Candidatus Nanoarchaeia archaeon]